MLLPLTDLVALLGIGLVCCAVVLALLPASCSARPGRLAWFVLGWLVLLLLLPAGPAGLPVLAYIRGVSSDLSFTTVLLACISLRQGLLGFAPVQRREISAIHASVAATAVFLYPLALGWGDWDAYRLGWGSAAMWVALLGACVLAWQFGLRMLPLAIALALLAWTAGLLESGNLWDYLLDPWLVMVSLFQCAKGGIRVLKRRLPALPSKAAG